MKTEVITSWVGDGLSTETAYRPKVFDDYSDLKIEDTTGQPTENLHPKPNMYIVQIECSPETLLEIEDDPLYQVLWSEE